MSKRDKLVERILARPPEADFADVRTVRERHGWMQVRQSGSHVAFTKAGERAFIIPLRGGSKVKRVYLDQICERLGLD
ncbi:MAG TPA: type II toxin-antitoxin system HicA family toxin [Dehalococcoidia bacterium]|nr:type II toxin-antitoxin system HicA family toxin [Dehalococcoidia bacterium]